MKSKARSPTKAKGQSAIDVVLFALQCSQRIGQWLTLLSIVHILSTQIVVVFCPSLAEPLSLVLEQCVPYYKLGVSAYFRKAAIENVLKIWNNTKSVDSSTDDDSGNG